MDPASNQNERFGLNERTIKRINSRRKLRNDVARIGFKAGGVSVILAVCLIFFYLLYEVLPLFLPPTLEKDTVYAVAADPGEFSVMDEQAEISATLTPNGIIQFRHAETGEMHSEVSLPKGTAISALSRGAPGTDLLALGLENGGVLIVKLAYKSSWDAENKRTITPVVEYPYGESPLLVAEGSSINELAIVDEDESLSLAFLTDAGELYLKRFEKVESFMDEGVELEPLEAVALPKPSGSVGRVMLSLDSWWLYLLEDKKQIEIYDLRQSPERMRHSLVSVTSKNTSITTADFLLGGYAILLGDSSGRISQWFMADQDGHKGLVKIREFDLGDSPITVIESEQRRKGFLAGDEEGYVGYFNTTAHRRVFKELMVDGPVRELVLAPRGNALIVGGDGTDRAYWLVENEHPEVSLSSLWGKVWYENYDEPAYIWQSSSASNDFEPKLSLMPLVFGTLKAAFYAMLIAMPLAICGAIYTAYFMAPALRKKVKPTIELMEALPTVILGFLAGLWLAPVVEGHLPGVFAIFLLTPLFIVGAACLWALLPARIKAVIPEGWVPLILVPIIILAGWVSMGSSQWLESALFDSDMRSWLTNEVGVDFDQRNALIVGIAMGFAVIPTIFSIAEDAIFAVPRSLTFGSLALGATPWQTLVRVILPTASPGIFSGLMIGFGRAVGETMIVLMATGNTPIMDANIFEGLRALSANISVEMPEAEVDSSHFRILFLSGFVLFLFTFALNTSAESVRHRLRKKYGSL